MALTLLLNKNGNNNNSKNIELHVVISYAIANQLLKSFTANKNKIFDKKE